MLYRTRSECLGGSFGVENRNGVRVEGHYGKFGGVVILLCFFGSCDDGCVAEVDTVEVADGEGTTLRHGFDRICRIYYFHGGYSSLKLLPGKQYPGFTGRAGVFVGFCVDFSGILLQLSCIVDIMLFYGLEVAIGGFFRNCLYLRELYRYE